MAYADFNLGGLRDRVKFRLQNVPKYSNAMVDLALNKAVVRLMLFIRNTTSICNADTYVLTSGEQSGKYAMEYPLPDNALYVDSLSFDGQRPIQVMDQIELANTGIEEDGRTGDPEKAYFYVSPERTKYVVLWPRPGRTARLQFYGGIKPDPMDDDEDIPPFDEEYSDPLVSYAVAYLLDGQPGQEERADRAFAKWKEERNEAKINQRVNRVWKTRRVRDF